MTLYSEILRAYRGFGASMRRQLEQNLREERLLLYAVLASFLLFVARVPGMIDIARNSTNAEITIANLIGTSFVTTFFFGVIMMYGIASVSHLIAKIFKGAGTFQEARLAFFWSALVIAPLYLVVVASRVFIPVPEFVNFSNLAIGILFVYCWGTCLSIAEKFEGALMTSLSIVTIFGLIAFGIRLLVLV
ncbi:MAG: YIP1 family protein [Henriciella sp.]|nr:YIP1 family protein [Henriciella sp.]